MNSTWVPAAREFVQAFVVRARRARYLGFLDTRRGQRKFLQSLDHFRDLDDRYARPLSGGVEARLRALGAPSTCSVLKADGTWRENVLLGEALKQDTGAGDGVLIVCVPGRLAYLEGGGAFEYWVCCRTSP